MTGMTKKSYFIPHYLNLIYGGISMNMMEARTRVEGLLDKRTEILNDIASIVAKAVASRSQKNGEVEEGEINTLLKDFTPDEKYLIMIKVVSILARNSNLRTDSEPRKKSSSTNDIFASRGYR
jgi:hypothetical protein